MKSILIKILYIIPILTVFACENQKHKTYKNPEIQRGQKIFQAQCRSCHEVHQNLVGPALADVGKKYEEEWLKDFIRDSQRMIKNGDKKALKVYQEYNEVLMPSFTISDEDIKAILAYIQAESKVVE